jgi:hypothetical protein
MVALVEQGSVNTSLDLAGRLVSAVGVTLDLRYKVPFGGTRQADIVHAWCGGYSQRRLNSDGLIVLREVEIGRGPMRGWIDLLAWQPDHRVLIVVELKTEIHDVGQIERTLGWYGREARAVAAANGWRPRIVSRWLLVLATAENDRRIMDNATRLSQSFPARGSDLEQFDRSVSGLAMIYPGNRRRHWLLGTWVDGRRTPAPYADYRDAAAAVRQMRTRRS